MCGRGTASLILLLNSGLFSGAGCAEERPLTFSFVLRFRLERAVTVVAGGESSHGRLDQVRVQSTCVPYFKYLGGGGV